jgi:hypothetical protein
MSKDKEITFKLTAQGAELAINALDKVAGTRHLVNYLEAQYREQMKPLPQPVAADFDLDSDVVERITKELKKK